MIPRLKRAVLPDDHLNYAARSPDFRQARKKDQKQYMVYRRAMTERGHHPMDFKIWRQS